MPSRARKKISPHFRRLRHEPLEDRRVLAAVTVTNALDVANGDTSSIANLIANDGGDGIALREAIEAANNTLGADTVDFGAALSGQTILLGGTELAITDAAMIDAMALDENVTIDAQRASRVINITADTGDFTIAGLTLTGGRTTARSRAGAGGAIRLLSSGNLTLIQSTVSGNSTVGRNAYGGGIFANGDVTLTQSTVSGNSTAARAADGGGIWAYGEVILNQSTVSGNSTTNVAAEGGGIRAGAVTLLQSTVSGNSTRGSSSEGGGIWARGDVTISQSTVSGNSTAGDDADGGGIFGGIVTLTQSTVSYNSTAGDSAEGGGIRAGGAVTLTQSTVSGNTTAGLSSHGGGIYARDIYGVTLIQSTVSGNSTAGYNGDGGGIYAKGHITLTESTVSGNSTAGDFAGGGGVLTNYDVTLIQSTLSSNSTSGVNARGGGISSGHNVTVSQSAVSDNSTSGVGAEGGGIRARGDVTLTQSTVSGNSTVGDDSPGGAIYAEDVSVSQSTVDGNSTAGVGARGGAIFAKVLGVVTLSQSTLSGNSTSGDGAHGGAVSAGSSVSLTQSTVTANQAQADSATGGGVWSSSRAIFIDGSIIAGNTAGGGSPDMNPGTFAPMVTVNYSLIGTGIAPNSGANNIVTDDPMLAPLADNGGPTFTHALLPDSPAIDAGDPSAVAGMDGVPEFDQRGAPYARVLGAAIDIGAFEAEPQPTVEELLQQYVDEGVLNWGQANSLLVKLADHGNRPLKPKRILPFINHVDAFVRAGILTPEQGDALIDAALQPPPVEPSVARDEVFAAQSVLDDGVSDEPALEISAGGSLPHELAVDTVFDGFAVKKNPRHRRR